MTQSALANGQVWRPLNDMIRLGTALASHPPASKGQA